MKNNITLLVGIVFALALAACGPTQNGIAPVEGWPEVTTRMAAESTAVALTPTVAAVGSTTIQIAAANKEDALQQIKSALADNTGYETVNITVVSGGTSVLTATYKADRTRSILWADDWRPTLFTLETAASEWNGDEGFWGEWGDTP